MAKINSDTVAFGLEPRFDDVIPGRPDALTAMALRAGLRAQPMLGPVERIDPAALAPGDFFWLHVDRAGGGAAVLTRTLAAPVPVLLYLLARFTSGDLFAFAVTIPGHDHVNRVKAAHFLLTIDWITPPTSHAKVFGGRYAPQAAILEPQVRERLREHARDVVVELAIGAPRISRYPFEVSRNGGPFVPMVPIDNTLAWGTVDQLYRCLGTEASLVLASGGAVVAAESGPASGVRMHTFHPSTPEGAVPERPFQHVDTVVAGPNAPLATTD